MSDLKEIQDRSRAFVVARNWEKYQTPKNLSMALMVEAAELLEHFQWRTEAQSTALEAEVKADISEEMADVLIYLVRMAEVLEVDLIEAAVAKISKNERKYPLSRTNPIK